MKAKTLSGLAHPFVLLLIALAIPVAVIAADEWIKKEKVIREALEKDIETVKEIDAALKTLEVKRPPTVFRIINCVEILSQVPDFHGPSPILFDPEGDGGGMVSFEEFEEELEPFADPDTLIEIIQAVTGEENWPGERGFGTISYHRGSLLVWNTQEIIDKIEKIIEDMKKSSSLSIAVEVYFLNVPEESLKKYRGKKVSANYSLLSDKDVTELLLEAASGKGAKIIQSTRIVLMNRQRAYAFGGESQAYLADMENTGGGIGLVAREVADPIARALHSGVFLDVRAVTGGKNNPIHLSVRASTSRLKGIKTIDTTEGPVQIPEIDLQVTNGDITIPNGHAALLGGSRATGKTAKRAQSMVLVVPKIIEK
jgi:hypothetical protein